MQPACLKSAYAKMAKAVMKMKAEMKAESYFSTYVIHRNGNGWRWR